MRRYSLGFFFILSAFFSVESRAIDLTGSEHKTVTVDGERPAENSGERWFERFDISGFAAAGYYHTGKEAKQKNGRFNIKETSLFVEAEAGNGVSAFLEWQAIRLGAEESKVAGQTAEAYIHFRNILKSVGNDLLGVKLGRFDIPYGDEYLWQDSIDNPLITPTVAWPYGWDEGILLYGKINKVGWVASVTDGDDDRSRDDHGSKSYTVKVYGNPIAPLYLSASYMKNGTTSKTGLEFAGSHIEPVTGSSVSQVRSESYELDAKFSSDFGHLGLTWGQASVSNIAELLQRRFSYYSAEALANITDKIYGVLRHSAIGTFNSAKGYHFDGKPFANGNVLGFGVRSLARNAIGVGYRLDQNTTIKAELSRDHFRMLDGSTVSPGDKRDFFGIEAAVKF